MSKSYVTLESRLCLVCACEYSTGTILMDTKMRDRFERDTLTGWGLCDQHKASHAAGKVALVEIDAAKSGAPGQNATVKPEDAYRTGRVFLVDRAALQEIINVPVGTEPIMFVDEAGLEAMFPPEVFANAPTEPDRSSTGDITQGPQSVN